MERLTFKFKNNFRLSNKERFELYKVLQSTSKVSIYRRAEAIVALDEGESPSKIANRLHVSRQVIYKWIHKFQINQNKDITNRLNDRKRIGRPKKISGVIDSWILEVIELDPRDFNYQATIWTAKLLSRYIQDKYDLSVSYISIRRALDRLEFRWKRPRYVLAKRPVNWRRKKGA